MTQHGYSCTLCGAFLTTTLTPPQIAAKARGAALLCPLPAPCRKRWKQRQNRQRQQARTAAYRATPAAQRKDRPHW